MTKMTYAQAIDFALQLLNESNFIDADIENDKLIAMEKLEALKEQLGKRSGSKGLTKTQKENEIIMERMIEALTDAESPVTVTELLAHGIEGYELTNQKASALLRKLVEADRVVKVMDGKKARFSLA